MAAPMLTSAAQSLPHPGVAGAAEALLADGAVDGLDVLLAGLKAGIDCCTIEPGQNPWPVLEALLASPGLERLHLLGHGCPGELRLGRLRLRQAWFRRLPVLHRQRPLQAIYFWSCSTGAGAEGQMFLRSVADRTGAAVFAAAAAVGAASCGGNWNLTVRVDPSQVLGRAGPRDALRAVGPPLPPMNRARPSPARPIPH